MQDETCVETILFLIGLQKQTQYFSSAEHIWATDFFAFKLKWERMRDKIKKNIQGYTENIRKIETWLFVWRWLYKVQGKYFLTFNKTITSSMHNNSTLSP